jgi:MFS family permease
LSGVVIAVNVFVLPRTSTEASGQAASLKTLFGYRDIATRPPIVVLALLRFLPTTFWGMALILIPLLLNGVGAPKTTIALYATVSQAVAALAQMATGRAADRWGARWPMVIVYSALMAGILGLGAMPGQLPALFVFGTLSTAAAWSLSTLLPLLVAQVTVPHERGRVLGWIHLWWNAGMIAGAMVGGILFERWASLPFLVAGGLNLVSIALALVFFHMESWKIGGLASR